MNIIKPSNSLGEIKQNNKPLRKNVHRNNITRISLILLFAFASFEIVTALLRARFDQKNGRPDIIPLLSLNAMPTNQITRTPGGMNLNDINYKINFNFAKYSLEKTSFQPSLPQSDLTTSELSNLTNFERANGKPFTDSQLKALTNVNFFITPNTNKFWQDDLETTVERNDDWIRIYTSIKGGNIYDRAPENAVFITSDFLLHVYHKLLEKELEWLENKKFYPALKQITDAIFTKATTDYPKQTDSLNKSSYERIIAFFAVPKAILDSAFQENWKTSTTDLKIDTDENILKNLESLKLKMTETSYQKAKQELELILGAREITASPLFDEFLSQAKLNNPQDYTQFQPRSHYTKNSILRSYFRSMMWFSRNNFLVNSPELTRDALNISLLTKSAKTLQNWEYIYIPTAFLVGKSDDLGIYEYNEALQEIGSAEINSDTISKIQAKMKQYQGPQIMSSIFSGEEVFNKSKEELLNKTKGFRFMGQRFTPDALIFSYLTQEDEALDLMTQQKLPSSTTALMIMSVLGNQTSDPLVQNWIAVNAPKSDKVLLNKLADLKQKFSTITNDVWTQNIYWNWLFTIKSLNMNNIDKTGYPAFMKNHEWELKNLQASLGSWTELKHDTLLYAKQSYAEMGNMRDETVPPPVPKGYVEPNIEFFDRLIAMVKMTKEGLTSRELVESSFRFRNEEFINNLSFLKTIAVKELQNEVISDDDFETLRNITNSLYMVLMPLEDEEPIERNARSALIADVHTDTVKHQILYEANGIPNYIYVAVKDKNGARLTKGLVFNYYEFVGQFSPRLTDQDWWTQVYTEDKTQLPPIPSWAEPLYE